MNQKTKAEATKHKDIFHALWARDIEDAIRHILGGTDVNIQDEAGRTPLYYGCWDIDFVDFLIQKGANPNIGQHGDWPLIRVVLAAQSMPETVVRIVQKLILAGADVNAGEGSCTALHYAAENGKEPIAEVLLRAGAHVDSKDLAGQTPLFYAVCSSLDATKMLITWGADVNAVAVIKGQAHTPLSHALTSQVKDRVEIVALLKRAGAIR